VVMTHLSSSPVTARQMIQRGVNQVNKVTAHQTFCFQFPAAATNLTQENNEDTKENTRPTG
jgi:hypothetical protein